MPKSVAEIDNSIVSQIDIDYEEVSIDAPAQEEEIGEIDWSKAFETVDETIVVANSESEKITASLEKDEMTLSIPSAKFYEDDVLETMILLENISELGDHREIPYLKYLLQNERSIEVQERIRELIKRFASENKGIAYFKVTQLEVGDSVFNELMEKSDLESKLILLEQIIEVGDEKEIPLLNAMIASDDRFIGKKAKLGLKKLMKRLAIENSQESHREVHDSNEYSKDIFEVDFKIHKSKVANSNNHKIEKSDNNGSTLFDHICSMSTKLYNKFNG